MQALLRLLGPLLTRLVFGGAETKGGAAAAQLWKSRAKSLRPSPGKAALNRWNQPANPQQPKQSALAGLVQTLLGSLHLRQATIGPNQATTTPASSPKGTPPNQSGSASGGQQSQRSNPQRGAVANVLKTVTTLVVPGLGNLLSQFKPVRNLMSSAGITFGQNSSPAAAATGLSPKSLIAMMGKTPQQIQAAQAAAKAGSGAAGRAGGAAALAGTGAVAVVTRVLTGFVAVAAVLAVVQRVLKGFGEHIVEGNRYLTQFNGKIGAAYARLDRQEITLGLRQGRATENSASGAADALHELNEAMQPLSETFGSLGNLAGTGALKLATIIAYLGDIAATAVGLKALAEMIEWNTRRRLGGSTPDTEHIRRVASGFYALPPAGRPGALPPLP